MFGREWGELMSETRYAFTLKLRDANGNLYEPAALRGRDATSIYNYSLAGINPLKDNETEQQFIARFQNSINPYPVDSIYMSVIDVDPGALFGGDWARIQDKFLFSVGSDYETTPGNYPEGEAAVNLTANTMPSHTHQIYGLTTAATTSGSAYPIFRKNYYGEITSSAAGGNSAHNNIPPYIPVYVWKRVS